MLLEVKNLNVKYRNATINTLNNINLEINSGEIVVIGGASGSGKSTLANFIAGLLPNNNCSLLSGTITYFNENIYDKQPYQRNLLVSLLFQNPTKQFCMRTLREELQFILGNLMVDDTNMDYKINEIIHALPIFEFLDTDFELLSTGQKQLAALASILIINPRLLVLDEPFSHLDNDLADRILICLHRFARKENMAILVIDHLIERWLDIADRFLILNRQGSISTTAISKSNYEFYKEELIANHILVPYSNVKRVYHEKNSEIIIGMDKVTLLRKNSEDVLLYDIDVNIPRHNTIAIFGKSGVGKTTLLEAILYNQNYRGTIYFNNKDLNTYKAKERFKKIRLIRQESDDIFMCDRIIDEVVDVLRLNYKMVDLEDIMPLAIDQLKACDLYAQKKMPPQALSNGQRRRLAIRLALLSKVDLLLIDEPTFGQDSYTTSKIMEDLVRLKGAETTIIFTTHNTDIAREYADMLICLEDRKLKEVR